MRRETGKTTVFQAAEEMDVSADLVNFESMEQPEYKMDKDERERMKKDIYRLAASLDRGQAHNPTSGEYYAGRVEAAQQLIESLIDYSDDLPTSLDELQGEWELIYSTAKHGIFRSSPFFLAVQEAYNDQEAAENFFQLHDLQTTSWGVSKVGRVAQHIESYGRKGRLFSEFDSSLFSMTSIPVVGFFKLFPTFGGCFATTASVELDGNQLKMEVEHTEMKKVPGLAPLTDLVVGPRVPVNEIWSMLPWNEGRKPTCKVTLNYVDQDMRIVSDDFGEYFVYTRPVDPQGVRER